MRVFKFFLVMAAGLALEFYWLTVEYVPARKLVGGEVVLIVAVSAVIVVFAIFVYLNRKVLDGVVEGKSYPWKTMLFSRKQSSRESANSSRKTEEKELDK